MKRRWGEISGIFPYFGISLISLKKKTNIKNIPAGRCQREVSICRD
jgi:hypothetical protein